MITLNPNNISTAYTAMMKTSPSRQAPQSPSAPSRFDNMDTVSISDEAKAMMTHHQSLSQEQEIQKNLDAIKLKPQVERTFQEREYVSKNDKKFTELHNKIKASGFESLLSDEIDYMQKASGMVNTASYLSVDEKALYDELVNKGDGEIAQAMLLVGMSRIGMEGQSVTLPNGRVFDPINTEISADSIRNLFIYMFVDNKNTDHQFESLASYLDKAF